MPSKEMAQYHGRLGRWRGYRLLFLVVWPLMLFWAWYSLPKRSMDANIVEHGWEPQLNPENIPRSDSNAKTIFDVTVDESTYEDEDDERIDDYLNEREIYELNDVQFKVANPIDITTLPRTEETDDIETLHFEANTTIKEDVEIQSQKPTENKKETKKPRIQSNVRIMASTSGSGFINKFYYRFENVKLKRRKLTVYYDPEKIAPPKEHWVDIISTNASYPKLPTMLVIKGDVHDTKWYYLPVVYEPSDKKQPKCKSWVYNPTYLLQVRYSYNIWHTWNEGLMGLFQTLRELGHLPLAYVGKNGKLTEIEDGKGFGCPYEWELQAKQIIRSNSCNNSSIKMNKRNCDPINDSWCQEGAVISPNRFVNGPSILPFTASSLVNIWSHLYHAITADIRDWAEIDDTCFKELIVGKTSTLNFYQALNSSEPEEGSELLLEKFPWEDAQSSRVEAMAVFKAFVTSAQREWVSEQLLSGKKPFAGYPNSDMEKLRKGIGPEDLDSGIIEKIVPKEVPGMLRSELKELRDLAKAKFKETKELIKKFKRKYGPISVKKTEAPKKISKDLANDLDDYEARAAKQTESLTSQTEGEGSIARRQFGGSKRIITSSNSNNETLYSYSLRRLEDYNFEPDISKWFIKEATYHHEEPRPVVVYMSRNFFSRGVLNEADILAYVLSRYNVTIKVTTFEEPLLEVMETLGSADVVFGMHGAGWTNALFIKRGATTMQMFPYGWRLPDGTTVRGYNYREIVYASECKYLEWVNQRRDYAFFRRIDYQKQWNLTYSLHPDPSWPLPQDSWPGNPWIYQNTYVDMDDFRNYIDAMMAKSEILPMHGL